MSSQTRTLIAIHSILALLAFANASFLRTGTEIAERDHKEAFRFLRDRMGQPERQRMSHDYGGAASREREDTSAITKDDSIATTNSFSDTKDTSALDTCRTDAASLDSIPFLYTKNMFLSYDIIHENPQDKIGVAFDDLTVRQRMMDSFRQTYNELASDCPTFADIDANGNPSPVREIVEAFFMFGFDEERASKESVTNNSTSPADFSTSFFLFSFDLKCSYCQRQQTDALAPEDPTSCSIPIFEDIGDDFEARDPMCSCTVPSKDQFMEIYQRRLNELLFPSNTTGSPTVALKDLSEIQVEPVPKEAPTSNTNDAKELLNTEESYHASEETSDHTPQTSPSSIGWTVPIDVSATIGCRPSSFVLLESNETNGEGQLSVSAPTKLSRSAANSCQHLIISSGVPKCYH